MEPYDSNQSTQRALSQTSNHLSESSSSLANQVRGISQSPSKQSSIARQQSVQSEVNGEQREEGIKFERLKNLQVCVRALDRRYSKTLILSTNVVKKSLETEFLIAICCPPGDKLQL